MKKTIEEHKDNLMEVFDLSGEDQPLTGEDIRVKNTVELIANVVYEMIEFDNKPDDDEADVIRRLEEKLRAQGVNNGT